MQFPERVHIREVSPRDGLQNESTNLSTEDKIRLVDMLSAAGFPQINATSFVSPKAVPQMADAALVMAGIQRRNGVVYDASVPNLVGVRRAIDASADAISVFVAASDGGSRSNVRRSTEDSMTEAEQVIGLARLAGVAAIGTIATAFGSPYEGTIPVDRVVGLARRFADAGATGVALGDTTGEGTPRQVADMVTLLLAEVPGVQLSLHLHDTRGLALANALAAMDAGVTRFDAAVGGIGGSPFTRNSTGNVCTEDLVHMCEEAGVRTGIDLDLILAANRFLEERLGHPLPGKLGRVGRSKMVVTS